MILLIDFDKNGGGYGILIIFFGIFLIGSSFILQCGKEGGRRPKRKPINGNNGNCKSKKKKEDPFESERKKKRKKSTKNRRQQKSSPPSDRNNGNQLNGENVEGRNHGSDVAVEMPSGNGEAPPPLNDNNDDKNNNEIEAGSQPENFFGSDMEKPPPKSNIPPQPSECDTQKPTEKIQSVKEQETPLYTDNYESLKEKEAEEAKKKAAAAATLVLAETKNVQESQPLNTLPAETAAAPIPVISPSNPAPTPTPEKGEEKEEEEKESDKEDSSKKSSKKKKKKHSKKKKKDKSSKKKKKKKKHHHQDKKVEEEEEDKKEDEKKKKVDEPVIVYPYSLTPPSTKTSKMKYLYEKGLTTRLNDELMMTENGGEEQQQLVEAETQVMSVKSNVNNLEQPQSLLKSDKTQFAKTNATTKLLTGIENEEKQIKSSKTSLLNVKNGNEIPLFSARGLYDGEQLELPKPGPNEEQLSPSKSREPPPSPVLQSPIGKNGILMATLGPADRTLTPAKDDANPPSKLQSHLVLAPEKQNEAAPKTLTILNPVNGGSLAVTNQMKAPLLTNESKAKSDWKSFLEAAPVMSTKFDLQPQGGDEAAADMPSKIEELQKTQKSTTNNTLKPKIMTQSDKAKNIAKYGLKCSPAEYPTFGDILSDWSTVDGVVTAAKMKEIDEKEIRRRKVMEQQQQKDAAVANAVTTKKENKDEEKFQQQPKKSKQEIPKVDEKEKKKTKPSGEKVVDKKYENEEDRLKKLRENAPTPKKFKRTSWEEKIAKGEVMRKKHEYPTMNDVVSDWESEDSSSAAGGGGAEQQPKPKQDAAAKESGKK